MAARTIHSGWEDLLPGSKKDEIPRGYDMHVFSRGLGKEFAVLTIAALFSGLFRWLGIKPMGGRQKFFSSSTAPGGIRHEKS